MSWTERAWFLTAVRNWRRRSAELLGGAMAATKPRRTDDTSARVSRKHSEHYYFSCE